MTQSESRLKEKSLCKKCARKISNCHKTYFEIVNGLNNGAETSSCCVADEKRPLLLGSPTGSTPAKKRLKTSLVEKSHRENARSKKCLFNIADEICNMMSLPVCQEERNVPIFKLSFLQWIKTNVSLIINA